jgi:hypothetical protein
LKGPLHVLKCCDDMNALSSASTNIILLHTTYVRVSSAEDGLLFLLFFMSYHTYRYVPYVWHDYIYPYCTIKTLCACLPACVPACLPACLRPCLQLWVLSVFLLFCWHYYYDYLLYFHLQPTVQEAALVYIHMIHTVWGAS